MRAVEYFLASGILSWPLIGFFIVAIALIAELALFWFKVNRRQSRVLQDVLKLHSKSFV